MFSGTRPVAEPLSKRLSRAILETRADRQEIEKLRSQPERYASVMRTRALSNLTKARETLVELFVDDPFIVLHLIGKIREMPWSGPFFLTVPIKDEKGAGTGVGFEYRGDIASATKDEFVQKFTVVIGTPNGDGLDVDGTAFTESMVTKLAELCDIENLAWELLETFGPIED
ncbi:MAG: hypothetical protein Q8L64_06755 [bacterium]|nr:hypothetical protein [bacterium]